MSQLMISSVETDLLVTGKKTVPSFVHLHWPLTSSIWAPGPVQVWTPAASNSRTIASRDKVASNSRRKSPKNSSLNVSAVKPQKLASNGLISIQRISSLKVYLKDSITGLTLTIIHIPVTRVSSSVMNASPLTSIPAPSATTKILMRLSIEKNDGRFKRIPNSTPKSAAIP